MKALRLGELEYRLEMFQRVYWSLDPAIKLDIDGIFVIDSKKRRAIGVGAGISNQVARNICRGDFHQKMLNYPRHKCYHIFNSNKFESMNREDDDIISDDSHDGILKPVFLDEEEPDFESGQPVDGCFLDQGTHSRSMRSWQWRGRMG